MASNNDNNRGQSKDNVPLCQRTDPNYQKVPKDQQKQILDQLNEMFAETIDKDIIVNVAENCKWDIEQSIEALITISDTGGTPMQHTPRNDHYYYRMEKEFRGETFRPRIIQNQNLNIKEFQEFQEQVKQKLSSLSFATETNNNKPKSETKSLCGLKVQYRTKGTENNNSDDDADVVIEEESSDYNFQTPPPGPTGNVCQFLSFPTQCPPKTTFPKMRCISSPSPPPSPKRGETDHLQSIETNITDGYKIVVLMRGVPGCGKSYLAKNLIDKFARGDYENHIFSADDYFVHINNGVYKYDPNKLSEAHIFSQNRISTAMRDGRSPLFVDNTNTRTWEMQVYVEMAVRYGYIVETLEPRTSWARNASELARKNCHDVPKEKIRRMLERYEPNISGEKLIKMFKYEYSNGNIPPQMRKLPIVHTVKSTERHEAFTQYTKVKEETEPKKVQKVPEEPKPQRHPRVTPPSQEEEKEFASFEDISKTLRDLKALNNFDGWEPKITRELNLQDISNRKDSFENNGSRSETNTDASAANLKAIGAEKHKFHTLDNNLQVPVDAEKNDEESDSDITADSETSKEPESATNELQVMPYSAYEITVSKSTSELTKLVNDGLTTHKLTMTANGTIDFEGRSYDSGQFFRDESKNLSSDEQFIRNVFREEASPVRKTSSNSDKTSDIDMSQYELCSSPGDSDSPVQDRSEDHEEIKKPEAEASNSSGLSSIFSFFKNSFAGPRDDTSSLSKKVDNVAPSGDRNLLNLTESAKVDKQQNLLSDWNKKDNQQQDKVEAIPSAFGGLQLLMDMCQAKTSEEKMKAEESLREAVCKRYEYFSESKNVNVPIEKIENLLTDELGEAANQEIITPEDNTKLITILENDLTAPVFKAKKIANEEVPTGLELLMRLQQAQTQENLRELVSKQHDLHVPANDNLMDVEDKPIDVLPADRSFRNDLFSNTTDVGTNTTPYDFNVAYVGGTLESGYRIIDAHNRNINATTPPPTEAPIPFRFALDKGTMTGSATLFGTLGDEREDRTNELIKLFPDVPVSYLKNLYINLCRNDFDWAVDHLRSLGDPGSLGIDGVDKEIPEMFTPEDEAIGPKPESPKSKGKVKNTGAQEQLLLQKEIEKKFVIDENCYDSHVLKIKKLRNREFGEIISEAPPTRSDENLIRFDDDLEEGSCSSDENFAVNENSEREEVIELDLGEKFIKELERTLGCADYEIPQGITPKMQIRKSMIQELHALWIESLHQQIEARQRQLEESIQKDAEFARSLEQNESKPTNRPQPPNLKEIMEMETALSTYNNNKFKQSEKSIEIRVVQQLLHEMFPNYDAEVINQIFEVQNYNFDKTVDDIQANSGKPSMTMADALKKRKHLLAEVKLNCDKQFPKLYDSKKPLFQQHDQKNNTPANEEEEVEEEHLTYDLALKTAHESRAEARRQMQLRDEVYAKASRAYKSKHPEVALYYSELAKDHMKKVEKANSKAASAFLAAQTHVFDENNTLDLHHLHVNEAQQAMDIFLDRQIAKLNAGDKHTLQFFIVTGRGARSKNQQSRIKPAIAKKLAARRISFSEANPGCLKVVLKKLN